MNKINTNSKRINLTIEYLFNKYNYNILYIK